MRERVLQDAAGARLWMNAYSCRQFSGADISEITVDEDFLEKAGPGDFCFVEGLPLRPWEPRIERLYLYRWNRSYPADTWLDLLLDAPPWKLAGMEEFAGYSHERITKEIYIR